MCYFAQESLLEYPAPASLTAPETSAGLGPINTKLIWFFGRGLEDVRQVQCFEVRPQKIPTKSFNVFLF
jgi:hypothetical protein